MQLYYFNGSPFAWRIQLALALKDVDYDPKILSYSEGQHQAPSYLQLNPRGKVPTLVDGEVVVRESIAILAYLDRKYDWQWFGTSPQATGAIWQQIMDIESFLVPIMMKFVHPIVLRQLDSKSEQVIHASMQLAEELSRLNEQLLGRTWLVGNDVSAADVLTYPLIKFIERIAGNPAIAPLDISLLPLETQFPMLVNWVKTLEALPRVKETYPPTWKPAK